MNILFYTPLSTRSRDIESQAKYFSARNHRIFLLTQAPEGELHRRFRQYAVDAAFETSRKTRADALLIVRRMLALIRYCWRNDIHVVYAHLEPCNFIAVLSQYFIRARVIICRHHADAALFYPFSRKLAYRLTYRWARTVIVVSDLARKFMIENEHVAAGKIYHINLGYDFGLYELPLPEQVRQLRESFQADIVLITVCRFTVYKRPELSVMVLKQLLDEKMNVKLILLGEGEQKAKLLDLIQQHNLAKHCILPGYVTNVLDYMAAADILLHPSVAESSCITIKEAALVGLPVIVCRHVGDFDEVLQHGKNGFLVDRENFVTESVNLIKIYKNNPVLFKQTASYLDDTVKRLFDIQNTGPLYEKFFHFKP